MGRPKRREHEPLFDPDLAELPEGARWREWMGRVEAAIFSARDPVPRETLARLVEPRCNLDDLIADIVDELRARPYELVFVAGGWQFRTRPRFAGAIRAASSGDLRDAGAPELTPTEILAVTAIAYLQPATRAELSRLAGKEISRDVIGRLKRLDLIDGARRALRLCHDKKVPGGFWAGDATRPPRHRTARRRKSAVTASIGNRPRWRLGACRRRRRGFRKGVRRRRSRGDGG